MNLKTKAQIDKQLIQSVNDFLKITASIKSVIQIVKRFVENENNLTDNSKINQNHLKSVLFLFQRFKNVIFLQIDVSENIFFQKVLGFKKLSEIMPHEISDFKDFILIFKQVFLYSVKLKINIFSQGFIINQHRL